ncbi:MAG: hypothetical protein FGM43_05580 [Sinobacteraceae bacterium]|nr:hypothetical protein [Nevskiaceae bacterium]
MAASSNAVDDGFMTQGKQPLVLWSTVPFYPAADVAQYEATLATRRDRVRRENFRELSATLENLAASGADVSAMSEPLANILLTFDMMRDLHRARDEKAIDVLLENQFKAALDRMYVVHQLRPNERRLQFSAGSDPAGFRAYIEGRAKDKPARLDQAVRVYRQIDFTAYGSFTSMGGNEFQLTLHIQNFKTGTNRSFSTRGTLTRTVEVLASRVFDYFQSNVYPGWDEARSELEWIAMPTNPARTDPGSPNYGYSYHEAIDYCTERKARLPYSRELRAADAAGGYRVGGISRLKPGVSYPVLDRRHVPDFYVLNMTGSGTGVEGALRTLATYPGRVEFWCVRGDPSPNIVLHESLWMLHRAHESGDARSREIFAAVETIRYQLGETDAALSIFHDTTTGERFAKVKRLGSIEAALDVLTRYGIALQIPSVR